MNPEAHIQLLLPRLGEEIVVQFAPGEKVRLAPPAAVPRYGIVEWQPAGDGTYKPVVMRTDTWLSVPECERLTGLPRNSICRLIRGGFIQSERPTPSGTRVNIESLTRHLVASQDAEFWNKERRRRWSQSL